MSCQIEKHCVLGIEPKSSSPYPSHYRVLTELSSSNGLVEIILIRLRWYGHRGSLWYKCSLTRAYFAVITSGICGQFTELPFITVCSNCHDGKQKIKASVSKIDLT
jgi:hypothetical protein